MYQLLNYLGADGAPHAGIAVKGGVFDLEKAMGPVTTMNSTSPNRWNTCRNISRSTPAM